MTQLLQITPISREKFSGRNWRRSQGYAFAAAEALIPIVASELGQAAFAMPLGFVQTGEGFQLVAVAALQPKTSLFVAPDGRWLGAYVPAVLRGYPFRFMKMQDRTDRVFCVDEASGLVVDAGQGEPFFDDEGQLSKALQELMDLLTQVERSRVATQAAVDALAAAGLIQPWTLGVKQEEKRVPVTGLHRIDEGKLNALDDAAFLTLRRAGALALAYAQLLSMNQLFVLERLSGIQARLRKGPAAGKPGADAAEPHPPADDGKIKFH
jgi:hypothetical protein